MNKTNMLILSLIYKQPLSAYDIVKQINYMGIPMMFPCGESTVYIYTRKLAENNLIEATSTNNGKKTIYQITPQGIDELFRALEETTINYQLEDSSFSIAAIFLDIFPVEKCCDMLKQRLQNIDSTLESLEKRKAEVSSITDLPAHHIYCISRLICLVMGEQNGCKELLYAFSHMN